MFEGHRMKVLLFVVFGMIALGHAAAALGHGHPIVVGSAGNRLVVSGGTVGNDNGYANQIYVETDSAGDPQDFGTFTNFPSAGQTGDAVYWNVPGFEISGLADNSGLYLQTLARPVRDSTPVESRLLWYWDPTTIADDKVESAPASSLIQIRKSSTVNTLLTPATTSAPPAIKIAAPLSADMGFHNHGLALFLMPFPLPPEGAYGFFARLTSDVYGPSDPFLVVINNGGLNGTDMLAAAAGINREAILAGDYNHNDAVDAADFVVWRNTLNSTTQLAADGSGNMVVAAEDLAVWRTSFGRAFVSAGSTASAGTNVPEPDAASLAITAAIVMIFTIPLGRRETVLYKRQR
jgi:hypothetical protein